MNTNNRSVEKERSIEINKDEKDDLSAGAKFFLRHIISADGSENIARPQFCPTLFFFLIGKKHHTHAATIHDEYKTMTTTATVKNITRCNFIRY